MFSREGACSSRFPILTEGKFPFFSSKRISRFPPICFFGHVSCLFLLLLQVCLIAVVSFFVLMIPLFDIFALQEIPSWCGFCSCCRGLAPTGLFFSFDSFFLVDYDYFCGHFFLLAEFPSVFASQKKPSMRFILETAGSASLVKFFCSFFVFAFFAFMLVLFIFFLVHDSSSCFVFLNCAFICLFISHQAPLLHSDVLKLHMGAHFEARSCRFFILCDSKKQVRSFLHSLNAFLTFPKFCRLWSRISELSSFFNSCMFFASF